MKQIKPFITFTGESEDAIEFYQAVFDTFKLIKKIYHQEPHEKLIQIAEIEIQGTPILLSDSYVQHEWSITPGISFYIEMESLDHFEKMTGKLSQGGRYLMPPDNYGFSTKFCWIEDKFKINWQLSVINK